MSSTVLYHLRRGRGEEPPLERAKPPTAQDFPRDFTPSRFQVLRYFHQGLYSIPNAALRS